MSFQASPPPATCAPLALKVGKVAFSPAKGLSLGSVCNALPATDHIFDNRQGESCEFQFFIRICHNRVRDEDSNTGLFYLRPGCFVQVVNNIGVYQAGVDTGDLLG